MRFSIDPRAPATLYGMLLALHGAAGGAVWMAGRSSFDAPAIPALRPKLVVADRVVRPRTSQAQDEGLDLEEFIKATLPTPPAAAKPAAAAPSVAAAATNVSSLPSFPQDQQRPAEDSNWAPRETERREFKRAASFGSGQSGTASNLSLTPPLRDAAASLRPQFAAPATLQPFAWRRLAAATNAIGLSAANGRSAYAPASVGRGGVSAFSAPRSSAQPSAGSTRMRSAPGAGRAVDAFPGGSSGDAGGFGGVAPSAGGPKPDKGTGTKPKIDTSNPYGFYLNVARKQVGTAKLESYQAQGDAILVAVRDSQHSNSSYKDKFIFLKGGKAVQLPGSTEPSVAGTGISMIKPGVYIGVPNGPHDGDPSWWIKTQSGSGALPDLRDSDGDGQYAGKGEAYSSTATQILLHVGRSSIGCLNYRPGDAQKVVNAVGGTGKRFVLVLVKA
ncbi:MAG: hypothetical protein NTX64_13155 [Elusimicrobia bacterium]|nr:hypothetical protein [Elusimicrobiota bacterium]